MKNGIYAQLKTSIPLLEFRNITVIKGDQRVLDSISITINEGENIAVLGPNGAGKSSFIKTITREYYPILVGPLEKDFSFKIWGRDQWNIFNLRYLLGIISNDLHYTSVRESSGMEIVLSGFFSSMGIINENLVTRQMKKKAKEILEFLEIAHLKKRKISEMSSGEAQRFMIGRALIHDPKALILDEPTNSLDLYALHKFRRILRKISKSGVSIILVTQNLQDIIPEITRVILMKNGKFYKDGPKETILTGKNISRLFGVHVQVKSKNGYYYAFGY